MAPIGEREGERAQVKEVAAKAEGLVRGPVGSVVGDQVVDVGVEAAAEANEGTFAVDRLDQDPRSVAVLPQAAVRRFVVPEHERVAAAVAAACLPERDRESGEIEGKVEPDDPGTRLV